jgi:peptidoglycan/xylan/chitin deacetylase (PgdA/CDA1 family)
VNPWQWDEAVWRGHVNRVRAGRRLVPDRWPGGAQVAVAISFDADHETISLRGNETSPGQLAQGEYGSRAGVPRILRLLDEFRVPATFFVPAVSALLHPADIDAYVQGGHEVAAHGWIHERNTTLSKAEELDLTGRACDTLERLAGTRPVGIRTPSWDFSESTLDVIRELGLRYDSSLMADDEPYELLADGEPTGVVELPVEWIRDDVPYFMLGRNFTSPRALLEIWRDEFDAAYAEGGFFQLTMHPHVIGHRSRLVVLRELLTHIAGHDDVWFATHAAVAEAVGT